MASSFGWHEQRIDKALADFDRGGPDKEAVPDVGHRFVICYLLLVMLAEAGRGVWGVVPMLMGTGLLKTYQASKPGRKRGSEERVVVFLLDLMVVGLTKIPCPGGQSKYLMPFTVLSFFQVASSSSRPTQRPREKLVCPTDRIVAIRPS